MQQGAACQANRKVQLSQVNRRAVSCWKCKLQCQVEMVGKRSWRDLTLLCIAGG